MVRKAEGNVLRDYGGTILAAVVLAFLIRALLIEAFLIPSETMHPTLLRGDMVLVAKFPFGARWPVFQNRAWKGRSPRRGEVVLFSPPGEEDRSLMKRVIALGGDTVEIKAGKFFLNHRPVSVEHDGREWCGIESLEEGESHQVCWEPPHLEDFGPEKIPPGSLFLVSDLRTRDLLVHQKSRVWGIVPVESLKGQVRWIGMSIQPRTLGEPIGWIPRLRWERMFRRIE